MQPGDRQSAARRGVGVALFAAVMALTLPAAAQDSDRRLRWDDSWRRVNAVEYTVTAGLLAGFVGLYTLVPPLEEALWTDPIVLDRPTRRAVRARTRQGRNTAALASDQLATIAYLPPLILDPLIVAAIGDRNTDVAWQLFVISAQSYAITATLNEISKRVFARQRPYAGACAADPKYSNDCESSDRFRSFYSGHSAVAATSAGLICAHHTHVPLYGGGNADRFTCAAALVGMFATGTLRMVADRHWHSDVFVGHLLGFAVGYVLPTVVYYKRFTSKPPEEVVGTPSAGAELRAPLVNAQFRF